MNSKRVPRSKKNLSKKKKKNLLSTINKSVELPNDIIDYVWA